MNKSVSSVQRRHSAPMSYTTRGTSGLRAEGGPLRVHPGWFLARLWPDISASETTYFSHKNNTDPGQIERVPSRELMACRAKVLVLFPVEALPRTRVCPLHLQIC